MRKFILYDGNQFLFYRRFPREGRRFILASEVALFPEYQAQGRRLQEAFAWWEQENKSLAQARKARDQQVSGPRTA